MWSLFFVGYLCLGDDMARKIVKNEHKIMCVTMRLNYVLKYMNHYAFDSKRIWEGLWDGLKGIRILTLSPSTSLLRL